MNVRVDTEGSALVEHADLDVLVRVLRDEGYTVVGPTVRDGAIVLAELTGAADLPTGRGVEVDAGRYRVVARADEAAFAHSAGPQSWKSFLHPARERLLSGKWDENGMVFRASFDPEAEPEPRYAFLGVRPCDLVAMGVLDGVLARGSHPDPGYTARRDGVFVVAVNCTEPGGACFCVSMGGGPARGRGLRPGADRAAGRRRAPLPRGGGHRGRPPRAGHGAARAGRRRGTPRRPTPTSRPRRTGWAAPCRRSTCARCWRTAASPRTGTRSRAAA